jgi:hypothetical protein
MAEQRITITIDEDGNLSAKTDGFKGEACLDAVEKILEEQVQISSFKKTDEYFQEQKIKQQKTITQKN